MRLPIRVRLTAWYALVLAGIIAALGAFLVLRLRSDLTATVDREVRDSSNQIAKGYQAEGAKDFFDVSGTVLPGAGSAAQVLDEHGRVLVRYGDRAAARPMVSPRTQARAFAGEVRTATVHPVRGHGFRARVSLVRRLGRPQLLVVAESLKRVDQSVRRVLVLLLFAGPAALLGTAAGGWWLARKALLPVGRMTSKADAIGIDRLDERIAVPGVRDEIAHLAVTLNKMLDRLEQGVDERHRLIADASHELRTPLATMRSELDVALRGGDLPPAGRAVLESAREEVDGMSRTIDNLLTLARVDEGKLELLRKQVDLRAGIEAAVEPLRPLAAAKRLDLEVDGEPSQAQADPERLRQALASLIENAIKFSPPGAEVKVSSWRRNGEAGVTVTDTGPGIPRDAQPHVFDRFYRVDRARGRDSGGSGLGLAICAEIASAHGGRVWVESEEGAGSAFSLALPAGRPPAT